MMTRRNHAEDAIRPIRDVNGVVEGDEEQTKNFEKVAEAKQRIRKMLDPVVPSKEEVEEHMLTHLPYRSWCEHCVKGKGKEMGHYGKKEQDTIEFHCDFAFQVTRKRRITSRCW